MRLFIAAVVVASTVPLASWPSHAWAEAPAVVPVQTTLFDAAGEPLDGTVSVRAALFDASEGGAVLHEETQDVAFEGGNGTLYVGRSSSLDLDLFRLHGRVWLALEVDGDALEPRLEVGTVPFAAFAARARDTASVSGVPSSAFASASDTLSWSQLEGVPADIADGDDGQVPAAGTGVSITPGGEVALDRPHVDGLATAACYDTVAELRAALDDDYAPADSVVPPGTMMHFDLAACPPGWSPHPGSAGRVVVGLTPGGTVGAVAGSPMTDGAPPGHRHTVPACGTTSSAATHDHALDASSWGHNQTDLSGLHSHRWSWLDDAERWYTYDAAGGAVLLIDWGDGMDTAGSGNYPFARGAASSTVHYRTNRHQHAHAVPVPPTVGSAGGAHAHDLSSAVFDAQPASDEMPFLQLLLCVKD